MANESTALAMIAHLDGLTKPKGSLGKLEDYCVKLSVVQGRVPPRIGKKSVYVFAGDHGVIDEGVSLYPKDVTYQMMFNFLAGGAAINALAAGTGWEVVAVDSGVAHDFPKQEELPKAASFLDRKIGKGTRNFAKEAAMTAEELASALEAGRNLALEAARDNDLVAIGDMGIGNTTCAAALLVASGLDAAVIVDRGTGIDDEALARKRRVVADAVAARGPFASPMEVMRAVGGYDLAMMTGFILGLEGTGVGCVLDGFPVTAAAYMAYKLRPSVTDYLFAGHRSRVAGHAPVLAALGLEPIVSLDMRLGEGTGAVIGGFIMELGVKAAREMASFAQAKVSESSGDEKDF